jgi:uncharacterized protein YcbK (DUF882 family)
MHLSPHFTLSELTTTSTGLANTPTQAELCRLRALCSAVLEPWRERVGALRVNSGFRSEAVNQAVGGSKSSQHRKGEAADVTPLHSKRIDAWRVLLEMAENGLPVDQAIIYETTGHIHVSHATERNARREFLVKTAAGPYVAWGPYQARPEAANLR